MVRNSTDVLVIGILLGSISCDEGRWLERSTPTERFQSAILKQIAQAQSAFWRDDLDANGKQDFWRHDVAGLYHLPGRGGGALRLIDMSLARADTTPESRFGQTPAPIGGYFLRAIQLVDEGTLDRQRFFACCYPAAYPSGGRFSFIINEDGVIYRKDLGRGGPPERYPRDPKEEGWMKTD
jgi:hypothetical protein